MNVSVLNKLEKGYIKLDWKRYLKMDIFPIEKLLELTFKIDSFKANRSAKEIILFKFKNLESVYVTIHKNEYLLFLDKVKDRLVVLERYEECAMIQKIIDKIKTYKSYKNVR